MAKYRCPNLADAEVKSQFEDLVKAFGEPKAYYLWHNIMEGNIKLQEKPKETKKRPPKRDDDFDRADSAMPSEQNVKEGIDFVFEQNPELASVGSLEQYSQYLDTIFPDSKVKDIVYHGSDSSFENFSKEERGRTTNASSAKKGFFFGSNRLNSMQYGNEGDRTTINNLKEIHKELGSTKNLDSLSPKLIRFFGGKDYINSLIEKGITNYNNKYNQYDIKNELHKYSEDFESDAIDGYYVALPEGYKNGERIIFKTKEKAIEFFQNIKTDETVDINEVKYNVLVDLEHKLYSQVRKLEQQADMDESDRSINQYNIMYNVLLNVTNPLYQDDLNHEARNIGFSNLIDSALSNNKDSIVITNTVDPFITNVFIAFEPEQIHILGSKQDVEGFKEFVKRDSSAIPGMDYNKLKISSFSSLKNLQQENEIVNSLVSAFLKKVDRVKKQERIPVVSTIIDEVLDGLKREVEFFSYYTEGEINEEDIENGALATTELNQIRVDNIQHVIDNFYTQKEGKDITFVGYKQRMLDKIQRLNYNVLDDLESDEDALERRNYEDNFFLKVDAEDSMSAQVKRLLSFVPKRDGLGKTKANVLGQVIYEDYNKVYSLIMNELVDTPINELYDALVGLSERNTIALSVLQMLDKLKVEDEQNYNKFFVVFRRQQANFITLMATPAIYKRGKDGKIIKDDQGNPVIETPRSFYSIETNRSGASDIVVNEWYENFKVVGYDNGLITQDKDTGQLTINITKAKELKKEFDEIKVIQEYKEQTKKLAALLNKIGITVTEEDLKRLNTFRDKSNKSKSPNKYSRYYDKHATFRDFVAKEMSYIFNTLSGDIKEDSVEEAWQLNNPFHSQLNRIKGLTVYYLERNPDVTSNSFKNGSGDTIQGNVMPHHASNRLQKIMNDENYRNSLLKIPFIKNSNWLNQKVRMTYNDSSKMKDSRQDAKGYAEQTPIEREYTKIGLFQKAGENSITIGNTPSDKTTFIMFETLRHQINFGDNLNVFNNGIVNADEIDVESPTMNLLYNTLVQSEINRIKVVRESFNKNKDNLSKLIPGYSYFMEKSTSGTTKPVVGSGGYFFFVPELNEVLDKYLVNGELNVGLEANKEFKEILKKKIVSLINDKVKSWNEKGVVNSTKGTYDFDKSYVNKLKVSKNNKEGNIINHSAAEMVTNYMLTYANQFMLITGDPALFTKPGHKFAGYKDLIAKTADNIFKRTAKDIAPGIEGLFNSPTFNTIFINEPKHTPEINKYKERLGKIADYYNNLDIADAQEWSTIKEHLNVLFAYGKISKATRDNLIKKSELRLTAENKEQYNFTWEELGTVLQPIKPVYVNSKYDETLQTDVHYYIKTSTFPLIPQLTEGFEIDKLRLGMEDNNIDRAVVNSGVKTGFANAVSIFTDNGVSIPSNIKSYIKDLSRDGFRIQQEVPYDPSKNEILEGSQLRKLKFANLTPDLEFKFNGENKLRGYQLKEIDDRIHNRLYQIKYNNLLKDLGIEPGENTIENVNKLREILIQTAQELDYSDNDILLLNTITTQGGIIAFENPLYFHNESDKIESMLNSIIKNRVLKNKMKGKSYVQGSSVGFTMKSESYVKNMEQMTGKRIALVKDSSGNPFYQGSLEYREYMEDGKKIIYGEVFAPFNFLNDKDNPLRIEDFVDEQGFIRQDKMDSRLFNALGYRIPTQGHSSMLKLKIVGFLPQEAGDLIIVPSAITKQMGADFDVDKLYTHFYNYKLENNKLSKVEYDGEFNELTPEQLQNMSMDITYSILSNEKVQNEYQFTPTDDPTLSNDKETINTLREQSKPDDTRIRPEKSSIASDEFQTHMVEVNAAGKIGISSYSSASANHILFQYAGVYLVMPTTSKGEIITNKIVSVMFSDENGNTYTDKLSGPDYDNNRVNDKNKISYPNAPMNGAWRLDKVYTFSGKLISDVIKSYQSASVDNAKDQNLYDLHQNKGTFSVSWLIARAGFDEFFIDRFITQPAIVDYVKRLNDLDKYTDSEYVPNKRKILQQEMFKELGFDLDKWSYGITPVSKAQMENAIATNGDNKLFQAQVLYNFIKYSEVASEISRIQTAGNTDTSYLGKSIYESIIKLDRVYEARTNLGNTENLFIDTTQQGAIDYGLKASIDLFANNNLYPLRSKAIRNIFETIQGELDRDLTEDIAHTIFSDIRASLFTQALSEVYKQDINTIRKELLYGTETIPSLAKQVKALQATTTNPFIKTLSVKTANKADEPDVIEFYSSKKIKEELTMDMILGWNELLSAPEGSEEKILGEKLVQYALAIGNQRSARDFGRFIPYDYVSEKLSKYYRTIDFENGNDIVDNLEANFVTQWFQHNAFKTRQITPDHIASANTFDGKSVSKDAIPDVIMLKKATEKGMEELYSYQNGDVMHPPMIVSMKTKDKETILFKKDGEFYTRIPTLGLSTKLIKEYNLNETNQQSIFRDKTKVLAKQSDIPQTPAPKKSNNELFASYNFNDGVAAVLDKIAKEGKNKSYQAIAKFYLNNINLIKDYSLDYLNPKIHSPKLDYIPDGLAMYREKLIVLNNDTIKTNYRFEQVFLHEVTHALLFAKLGSDHKTNKELQAIMDKLKKHNNLLYDKDWLTQIGVSIQPVFGTPKYGYRFADYIFTDTQEFAAALMTDVDLYKILSNIKYEGDKTFWDKIVEFVQKVLGIKPDNMLAEGMETVLRLINPSQSLEEKESDKIYNSLGDKTQSEFVYLPEDLYTPMTYNGKNFWNEIVPEARATWENTSNPIIIAYRGNKNKSFLENYKSGNTIGNPFDWQTETGSREEQGKKSTKKFIDWILTGNNYGEANATEQYRQALINDFKSDKWKRSVILYYQEKGYPTHATAIDYFINKHDWSEIETPKLSINLGFKKEEPKQPGEIKVNLKFEQQEPVVNLFNKPPSTKKTFSYKDKEIDTEFVLGKDQDNALRQLIDFVLRGNTDHEINNTITLEGAAGTGKTAVIGYLQKYFKGQASFAFLAPTHAATAELGFATVKTGNTKLPSTIQSSITFNKDKNRYVFTKKVSQTLGLRPIIVVDEISMTDKDDINHLREAVYDIGGKLILMGDEKQIPKVTIDKSATKPVSPAFTNFKKLKLTQIFRQSEDSFLNLLGKMRQQTSYNPIRIPNTDTVKFLNRRDYNDELLHDVQTDPENTVVISYTNRVVQDANVAIRRVLGREGQTIVGDIIVGYLGYASKQIEKGDLANSINYTITDITEDDSVRIIRATSSKLSKLIKSGIVGISNQAVTQYYQMSTNDSLTFNNLTQADFAKNNNLVADYFRRIHSANTRYANKQMSYGAYLETIFAVSSELAKVSVGQDYVYNPATDKMEVFNAITHKGIKTNGQGSLLMNKDVDYGHAITIHKSQGTTIDNVYFDTIGMKAAPSTKVINESGEPVTTENQALAYVAMSRAKKKLVVYEGDIDFSDANAYSALPSYSKYPVKPTGRIFKKAIENNQYIPEIGVSAVKRRVVNEFFRFRGVGDFNSKGIPYYDYSTGSILSDKKLIDKINSEYSGKVVKYLQSRERIVFTEDADNYIPVDEYSALPSFTVKEASAETNVDRMVNIKQRQIEILKKKLIERDTNKTDIKNKIASLEVEIKYLNANRKDSALEEVITKNIQIVAKTLDKIDKRINDNPNLDELYAILKNLSEVDIYIEGMREIDNLFSYESDEAKARIDHMVGTITRQRNLYLKQFKEVATMLANRLGSKRFETITPEQLFGASEDINIAVRETMNLANSKSMLTKFLHQMIQLAKQKIIDKQTVIAGQIDAWEKKLEQHTKLKGDKLHDIFMQKYKDGSWTGNYVSRYKQEFFDELAELKDNVRKSKLNKNAITRWLKENTTMITAEEIASGKSNVFSDEEMKRQLELIDKYNENKQAREDALRGLYVTPEGVVDEARVATEMMLWEKKYSPFIYLDIYKNEVSGKQILNQGNKYLLFPKPKDKWIDKNFDRIQNDPVLLEFYNFMTETFKENNKQLPFLSKVQGNYLPEIKKTFAEELKTQSAWETLSGLPEDFWNAITDQVEGEIDYNVRIGNRKFKSIPTRMMMNKLSADEKSKNVFKILKAHSAMSNSYYYKSQIEPLLTSGQQALEEMDEITKRDTVTGEVTTKDKWKKDDKVKGNLVNTKLQLEHQVEVFLYDNFRDVEYRLGKPVLNEKDKAKLKELDELLASKKITEAQYKTRVSTLGRQVTGTGVMDVVNKYTYLKALGLPNFLTPAVNLTFGLASNLTYAAGGIGVNLTDMRNAINMFMGAVINKNEIRKIGAFMEQLGILNEYNESLYGTTKTVADNLAFYLQNNTEKMNRGTLMLAHLLHSKVKNKNGDEVSVYHAFKEIDGKLVWDTENFGEMQVPVGKIGEHGINMFKFKTYITRVNQRVHGDYDSALRAKRTVVGRVLMMFKTWLPMAIADRFGAEEYDDELEMNMKGRYLVLWTAKDAQGNPVRTKDFLKIIATAAFKKNGLAGLSELDRALVRRNLKELQIIVQFTIAVAALTLAAGAGDDDDEMKFALRTSVNLLTKAQNDLTFFTNPSAMAQMTNNLIPVYASVKDIFNIVPVVWKTVSGDPTYQSGLLKDQNRLLMWGVQVTPFTGPGLRMWKNGERIIQNW